MTINVLIVDDHALVRSGLATILAEHIDFAIVGEAADGAQAVIRYRALRPDVVLMDLRMPVLDGVEATRAIRREFAHARILLVSTYRRDEGVAAALLAGACGYVDKNAAHHDLAVAIRAVHAGETFFSGGLR
jgi:DNA-binding NarL/FixJ family response regulator